MGDDFDFGTILMGMAIGAMTAGIGAPVISGSGFTGSIGGFMGMEGAKVATSNLLVGQL